MIGSSQILALPDGSWIPAVLTRRSSIAFQEVLWARHLDGIPFLDDEAVREAYGDPMIGDPIKPGQQLAEADQDPPLGSSHSHRVSCRPLIRAFLPAKAEGGMAAPALEERSL
jgi:hypothetical protein